MVMSALGMIGGAALSGISSAGAAKSSYKYSSMLQAQQNAWMERMSNTAHQREVKDLRAAGLNPILSATGGNGATTPSAGSSTMSVDNPDLLNSALATKQLKNETELKNSQKQLNNSAMSLNDYLGDKAHFESSVARETSQLLQEYGPIQKQAEIASINANTAKAMQDIANSKALTASQVNLNNNTARAYSYDNAVRQRNEQWHSKNKGQSQWSYGIGQWTGSIGNIFSGSANYSHSKR